MIRVILPQHLRILANISEREISLEVARPVTQRTILDALEARYPALCGTIRDHHTRERRPLLRFFACEEDVSHDSPDAPLPEKIASGVEPFFIVGAIAGGLEAQSYFGREVAGEVDRSNSPVDFSNPAARKRA